ncbi:VOC family protein [Streptomyces niveiscabiei]|uniref:VOC family protein n=1 Tax=Streptomyces niveiscabiei TaxID=164115 RepID=UPI0029B04318|nr:VOC family protein [Streptomyces niveiscabiei]MDX3387083.1 VOC family protein [Streptomyces niveiscabiei]
MSAVGRFRSVVVDCPDPAALAEFYAALLGGKPEAESDDWIVLHVPDGPRLAFNLAPDHVPPVWPSQPHDQQQFHLDVDAGETWEEVEAAERRALELGARPVRRVDEDDFRVFLDPAGHPFCLCRIAG